MATADRHLKTMSGLRDVTTTSSRTACGGELTAKVYDIAVRHAPELLTAVREALKGFPDPAP
jgi:hypothetical protein